MKAFFLVVIIAVTLSIALIASSEFQKINEKMKEKYETTTLGGGCFWCVEAVFSETKGVLSALSGYSGGLVNNPSYKEVTTGRTGHAEVVQITFDPEIISFEQILTIFFSVHDPTTLNRQGADVGPQYRSVIFYHTISQKDIAEKMISRLNNDKIFANTIVTQVTPLINYYQAEDYHQQYFKKNPEVGYCNFVIKPKMDKFRKEFSSKLK